MCVLFRACSQHHDAQHPTLIPKHTHTHTHTHTLSLPPFPPCVQAASQFNCLEFVGPSVVPEDGIMAYPSDKTQGPACSVACGPATTYRNYLVPLDDGAQVGQTSQRQVNATGI